MKNTSKFLAVMLAITGLFCCAVAVGIGAGFNAVRESTDKKIIAVAEKVREQYPDISEKELAQILNSDTAGIKGDFAQYGIKSDSGWVDIQSGSYATITIVIATAGVCVFGILLCIVFIRYCKKQKRQRLEIVKCLEKINNREYDLDLDGSTDDDMSLLKQEIQLYIFELGGFYGYWKKQSCHYRCWQCRYCSGSSSCNLHACVIFWLT